jgi:hypothetical protein
MVEDPLQNWPVDLPRLYGATEWERRKKFHLWEELRPAPDRDLALILYAIGEVGVGKQVGRVAVLIDRQSPKPIFNPRDTLFWELGDQTFRFSKDGTIVYCYEFIEVKGVLNRNPISFSCRLWGLDLDRRRVGQLARDSFGFDLRQSELDALQWYSWARD